MLRSRKRKLGDKTGMELKETLYPWYTDPSIDRDRSNIKVQDILSKDIDTTTKNVVLYCNGKVCIIDSVKKTIDRPDASREEHKDQQLRPRPLLLSVDDLKAIGRDLTPRNLLDDGRKIQGTNMFLLDSPINTVIYLGTRGSLEDEDSTKVEVDVSYWCIHIEPNVNAETINKNTEHSSSTIDDESILKALSNVLSLNTGSGVAPSNQVELPESDNKKISKSDQALVQKCHFINLREVGDILERQDAALLATANALIEFHRSHKFCSRCGHSTGSAKAGGCRQCLNEICTSRGPSRVYPRIDTATIMLITSPCGQYALLGRKANWPKGRYSTLAGFAEVGETLEHCVVREVFEESGVHVDLDSVRFIASQPWPFPRSLMVGFRGTALDAIDGDQKDGDNKVEGSLLPKIQHDENELEDVQWFHKDKLAQTLQRSPGSTALGYQPNDDEESFGIPGRASLARLLISHWVKE